MSEPNENPVSSDAVLSILAPDAEVVCTWMNRQIRLGANGVLLASRVGNFEDWDYWKADHEAAFALMPKFAVPIARIEPIDKNRIRLIARDGMPWILEGNPLDGGKCYSEIQLDGFLDFTQEEIAARKAER